MINPDLNCASYANLATCIIQKVVLLSFVKMLSRTALQGIVDVLSPSKGFRHCCSRCITLDLLCIEIRW